jgi:plasmid stabilization system protein ParE
MEPDSRIELSEDARRDLALQHAWYSIEAGADIAERYVAAFRGIAELLAHQPSIGLLRRFCGLGSETSGPSKWLTHSASTSSSIGWKTTSLPCSV